MVGVADELLKRQKEFEWDYEFRLVGASAFASSYNSWSCHEFIDVIKDKCQPDGYVYGVGCDTITSFLKLFKKMPKGLILTDIDPAVVAYTKMFVHCLARFASAQDFFLECCGVKNRAFYDCLEETILTIEPNPIVKEQMLTQRERLKMEWAKNFTRFHKSDYTPYWMAEGYQVLHRLALDGNIAVLHADLFDERLLNSLSELQDWSSSKNLIYMANASDHIHRNVRNRYRKKEDFVQALNQNIISRLALLKGQNYFIDTTQSTGYKLRLKTEIPYFASSDF